MKRKKSTVGLRFALLSILVGFLSLSGCGGSSSSTYSELLFHNDGWTLKTAAIDSSGKATELGSATIPGIPGTYTRSGNTVIVTMPQHNLATGMWVDLDFASGTGGTATSGKYPVTVSSPDTFTITDTASGTITGGTLYRKPAVDLDGTYSQSGTTITVTFANHGLKNGYSVQLTFTSGTATDMTGTVTYVDANTFTVTAASSATTSGNVTITVGSTYSIFGIAMHPSGKWVYVTSTYSCSGIGPFCWGAGLISRFAVNWNTGALTFEKTVRTLDASTNDSPVGLGVSPDGKYLYNEDESLVGIKMWGVNTTTGDLTYLAESAVGTTFMHGVGVSADGTLVYNGDNVFTVDTATPAITLGLAGSDGGGNSNVIIGSNMYTTYLSGSSSGNTINIYSLTTPAAPTSIATVDTDAQQAREVAVSSDGKQVISAGWCGLRSYAFDGSSTIALATVASNEYVDCGGTWATSGVREMYRNVSLNQAGNMIATAYFTHDPAIGQGAVPPSGYKTLSLQSDGSLALLHDYPTAYYSQIAAFYHKP